MLQLYLRALYLLWDTRHVRCSLERRRGCWFPVNYYMFRFIFFFLPPSQNIRHTCFGATADRHIIIIIILYYYYLLFAACRFGGLSKLVVIQYDEYDAWRPCVSEQSERATRFSFSLFDYSEVLGSRGFLRGQTKYNECCRRDRRIRRNALMNIFVFETVIQRTILLFGAYRGLVNLKKKYI